jgi:hypothetical protein
MAMGWWKTVSGDVIGDGPANYVDKLVERGIAYTEPSELPAEVRTRIVSLYVEDLGREPSESEIRTLLAFCLV